MCKQFDVVQEEGVDGGEIVGVEVFGNFFSDGLGKVGIVVEGQGERSCREDVLEIGEVGLVERADKSCFMHTIASCTACDLPDEMGVDVFLINAVPF